MAFGLTQFDNDLIGQLRMQAVGPLPIGGGYNFNDGFIPFQFPPKIKSDGKSGNWKVINVVETEPQVIWMGAEARKISLEITYIVTGHTSNVFPGSRSVEWNTDNISKIVKDLRGILYATTDTSEHPLWELTLYQHIPDGGGESSTWRTVSVSERPSDALITVDNITYATRTDITLDLELVTQIETEDDKHQNYSNARPQIIQVWY